MRIRRIEFNDSEQHKIFFLLIWKAFQSRGSASPDDKGQPKRLSKEDKRTDAKILRALKSISYPIGELEPGNFDGRDRILNKTGGVMELEKPEFNQLQKYCEDTQWVSLLTDVAVEMEDWLDDSEKIN